MESLINSAVMEESLKIKENIKDLVELRQTYRYLSGSTKDVINKLNCDIQQLERRLVDLLRCLECV